MYTRLKQLPYKTNALFRFYVLFIGLKTGKFCWTSIRTAEWIVYHYWRTQRNYTVSQLTPWNGIKINIVIWNSLLVLSLILCFTVYKKGYLSPSLPEVLHFFRKKSTAVWPTSRACKTIGLVETTPKTSLSSLKFHALSNGNNETSWKCLVPEI